MKTLIFFLGSMALFLFGVKFMGEGFESIVRFRLKNSFSRRKCNPLNYIVIGFLLTLLVQFSAVTTILTVGLANSGIISLIQALGLIMGANVATTLKTTMYIYNPVILMPFFAVAGVILYVFSKGKKNRDVAKTLIGIAIAVMALTNLSTTISGFKDNWAFMNFIHTYGSSWFMVILAGIVFTVLLQSSSATMVIIIALASQGLLSIDQVFLAIVGANIGTTSTTLISSLGTGKNGRRAAFMHLFFNVAGAMMLIPMSQMMISLSRVFAGTNTALQASVLHILFNLITMIIFIPIMKYVVRFTEKIIPETDREVSLVRSEVLDKRIINTPAFAEQQLFNQSIRLAELSRENIRIAMDSFISGDNSKEEEVHRNEDLINYLEIQIVDFLVKLSTTDLDERNQARMSAIHMMVADFEKIGDLALNIMDLSMEKEQKNAEISEDALNELKGIYSYMIESINVAIDAFRNNDKNMASTMVDLERKIRNLHNEYRTSHIRRLNRGKCSAVSGILYLDLLSTIERVGSISSDIARGFIKDIAV